MKLVSPLPHKRGRLEIIPLIDIMFFLLAAFMIVSIDKIKVKSLKVNLPTNVPAAQIEKKNDFMTISMNVDGQVAIDKVAVASRDDLKAKLKTMYEQNKDQKFLIAADVDGRYGAVLNLLGDLRAAGFQKVSFDIKTGTVVPPPETPGASAPAAPAAETPPATPDSSSSSTPAPAPAAAPAPPDAAVPATPAPTTTTPAPQ